MVQLRFEDPPEPVSMAGRAPFDTQKNKDRDDLLKLLLQHPNRWAIVSEHLSRNRANKVASDLKKRHPALSGCRYEFRAATKGGQAGVVYGRYISPDVNLET